MGYVQLGCCPGSVCISFLGKGAVFPNPSTVWGKTRFSWQCWPVSLRHRHLWGLGASLEGEVEVGCPWYASWQEQSLPQGQWYTFQWTPVYGSWYATVLGGSCFRMTALMQIQWSLKGQCTRKMTVWCMIRNTPMLWLSEEGPLQSYTHYQPVRVLFWTNWKQCVPKRHQLSFREVGLSHTSPPPFGAPTDRCRTRRCSMALRLQAVIRARLGSRNGATGLWRLWGKMSLNGLCNAFKSYSQT